MLRGASGQESLTPEGTLRHTRVWSTSISRRRALRGGAVGAAGLATAALMGCTGGAKDPAPKAAGSGALVRRGTIRQGGGKLTESYDPATMLSAGLAYWCVWGDLAIYENNQMYKHRADARRVLGSEVPDRDHPAITSCTEAIEVHVSAPRTAWTSRSNAGLPPG